MGRVIRNSFNPIDIQCLISLSSFYLDCPDGNFRCDNGQCISSYYYYYDYSAYYDYDPKCNGHTDCSDGSDEDDCTDFGK